MQMNIQQIKAIANEHANISLLEKIESYIDKGVELEYVDGHGPANSRKSKLQGLAMYRDFNDGEHVVLLCQAEYFCLNPLELRDDVPYLSRWSVGGNVMPGRHGDLNEAMKNYKGSGKLLGWIFF